MDPWNAGRMGRLVSAASCLAASADRLPGRRNPQMLDMRKTAMTGHHPLDTDSVVMDPGVFVRCAQTWR